MQNGLTEPIFWYPTLLSEFLFIYGLATTSDESKGYQKIRLWII